MGIFGDKFAPHCFEFCNEIQMLEDWPLNKIEINKINFYAYSGRKINIFSLHFILISLLASRYSFSVLFWWNQDSVKVFIRKVFHEAKQIGFILHAKNFQLNILVFNLSNLNVKCWSFVYWTDINECWNAKFLYYSIILYSPAFPLYFQILLTRIVEGWGLNVPARFSDG